MDDDHLAAAAADALAGFSDEPASLVVACRRVLAHHRAHGSLWWVCSRILAAADPASAARAAARELEADRTGDRLGATLPLLDEGEVVAIVGYSSTVDDALMERFDIEAVAVRVDGDDPMAALRRRRSDHAVRVVDAWDPVLERAARLLVAASAIGPERALVPLGTGAVMEAVGGGAREAWLVGGVGRVLPARVYEMVVSSLPPEHAYEEISVQRFDRIAGPRGLERPHDATARIDCPVVPELLRPLG
ncbi:MAG TPA: hypothetical protein VL119_12165 [Acidimicrobiia bacterium]|nr:hypothetical protein [Acidimicrobiia bacterium]